MQVVLIRGVRKKDTFESGLENKSWQSVDKQTFQKEKILYWWLQQISVSQLQIEATNSFGESLQKKLLDIEGLYSKVRSRYTFIQALVRRIRGLLRISRT